MRFRWTVLAALLLVAAPVAAQQEASFTLEQEGLASEAEVEGGGSVDLAVGLNLTGEGFSCTQEVEAPVNVTVESSLPSDAPPNASLDVTEDQQAFAIPAGEYSTAPYSEEANATVSASAGSGLRENVTATLTVTSTYPGGNYTNCLPMEFPSASSSPGEVQLRMIADDPPEPEPDPEPEDNATDDNTTQPPANDSDANASDEGDNGIPLPWQGAPLAAIGAALLLRSRRGGRGS